VRVLVRNIFSNWAGVIANLAVAFFLSPFLVHRLGDAGYGLWVLVLSVTGYMGLLDSGLRISIVKHTAEYNARKDSEGLNRVLVTGLSLYGSLSVIVVLLAFVGAAWFGSFFKVPAADVPVGRMLVLIAGVNVALTLPLGVFAGLLSGLQRYDLVNRASIFVLLLRTVAIVAAVWSGLGLITLGLIHVASQALNAAMLIAMSRHEFPPMNLRPRRLEWATVRTLYAYSGFIVLNNVAMFLLFYSGEVLIGMFVGTAAVTSYAIARSLIGYLSSLIGAMTQVFHPYASDQHERGNAGAVGTVLLIGTRMSLLIALPIGISFMIIGPTFISLWVGPEYGRSAAVLLAALTIPQLVWLSQSTGGNVLLGVGRHRFLTVLNLVTGIFAILMGLLLVRRFGGLGVAIGAAIPILVTQAIVLPIYTTRSLRLSFGEYATGAYLVPLAAVLPYAATLYAVSRLWPAAHLPGLALQVMVCLLTYVPFAFVAGVDRELRQRLLARFVPAARLADEKVQ
jgi:O-antigen/teichoic acid export membrane protein